MAENITVHCTYSKYCGKKKLAMNFIYYSRLFHGLFFFRWTYGRTDRAGKTRTGAIKWGRLAPVRDETQMGHL